MSAETPANLVKDLTTEVEAKIIIEGKFMILDIENNLVV
jgi:hypothetical protein